MKLTKRNTRKYKSEPSAWDLIWQKVDSLALEGKRYPLEAGRIFRCHGQRGYYKVQYIAQDREDNDKYEIHCWWQSTKLATPTMRGELRCVRPEIVRWDGAQAVVLDDDRADWIEEGDDGTLVFRVSELGTP